MGALRGGQQGYLRRTVVCGGAERQEAEKARAMKGRRSSPARRYLEHVACKLLSATMSVQEQVKGMESRVAKLEAPAAKL